jgi:starch synthase
MTVRQHAPTTAWRDVSNLISPIAAQLPLASAQKKNTSAAGTNFSAQHSHGGMTLRVLFVTSEIDDFVRVGGLAAVSAALPRALQAWADVRVLLPGYRDVVAQLKDLEIVGQCPALAELPACSLGRSTTADGLPIYVLLCPTLYERDGNPYGDANGRDWSDNDVRFARLASAAARLAMGEVDPGWRADLVHANDWPSALTPAYLAWRGARIPTILTIHNLAYQGLFSRDTLRKIGAPESAFSIEGVEFYGQVSFLKAGLIYATHLTTVSATYAREITTPAFGCGLEGVLRKRSAAKELTGIINGIDDSWDSQRCRHLPMPFGAGDWKSRRANSAHVRRQFGLAFSAGPLFALVARLVHQKGVDLVLAAADTIVASGGQIVVMGRGEPQFEQALRAAHGRRPAAIGVAIDFDGGEARRIFAGSDFTLMPSRFEPCGLSQMYAQRYGSLPLGHRTGGLAETIKDGKTGFLFSEPSAESFMGAVCRAFGTFSSRQRLNQMRSQAMAQPFGWSTSAAAYRSLYGRVAAAPPLLTAAA